ncbi:hypothetical protein GIB67_029345 [Kingdonia uniflora]|uniref:YTH domain-containing family protein n=1 Tax=Kingdonia uniflora TaxID=39325 RepID=A0A7J7NWM8_9MAGN|nr:hypothetical protein GIB67_029345 [Kingdonia uniflora]
MATKPQQQQEKLPTEEKRKNLKVDPSKLRDAKLAPPKERSQSDATSCISSFADALSSTKEKDVDQESLMSEQSMYYSPNSYYGYYYPGYEGSLGELDDQGYVLSNDGLDTQYSVQVILGVIIDSYDNVFVATNLLQLILDGLVVGQEWLYTYKLPYEFSLVLRMQYRAVARAIQGDNGLIYYMPSYQPGYFPCNPYVPSATIGLDGQYLGHQPYYVSPISPQPITSPGYFPSSYSYGSELSPSYLWDPSLLVGDGAHGNSYLGVPTSPSSKPNYPVPNKTIAPKSVHSSKLSNQEVKGSLPTLDVSSGPGTLNDLKQVNKAAAVLSKGYLPVTKFPYDQAKGGLLYPNIPVNYKANGRGWGSVEKLKTRVKANGISDFDLLNEQNRGPRTNSVKGAFEAGVHPVGSLTMENNVTQNTVILRDQYNIPDFPTKYDQALFFVIKSYSEDDIHKSIKYNVWASTPNGNKRLDSAYQDAQDKMEQKSSKCPVFLFFSVNASGQFCGVAEMIGKVDFNKSMDFWQQDKWNGFFPVKWHFIKDVPNPHFRHIILENNDNKPVTNSRDTQEVRFPQGIEMLNIFNNYSSKTSILDDFAFYESRQKAMQDKKIRPSTPRVTHLQKSDDVEQLSAGLQSVDITSNAKKNEAVTEVKVEE